MWLCTLASGSSGNCTVLSDGETHLLVDAGISARRIGAGLAELGIAKKTLAGILITHEHRDHISGLAVFLKKNQIPVYASGETGRQLLAQVPGLDGRLHTFPAGSRFSVGGLEVSSFATCHDTPESVGYCLTNGKTRIGIATDLGCFTNAVANGIEGADLLLLEANYDRTMLQSGPYPAFLKRRIASDHGHLSNEDAGAAARWAMEHGTNTLLLGHLSAENNRKDYALEAVKSACAGYGAVSIAVAPRSERSPVYGANPC